MFEALLQQKQRPHKKIALRVDHSKSRRGRVRSRVDQAFENEQGQHALARPGACCHQTMPLGDLTKRNRHQFAPLGFAEIDVRPRFGTKPAEKFGCVLPRGERRCEGKLA